MKRKPYLVEPIVAALKQAELAMPGVANQFPTQARSIDASADLN
jgi:hypothetical protein